MVIYMTYSRCVSSIFKNETKMEGTDGFPLFIDCYLPKQDSYKIIKDAFRTYMICEFFIHYDIHCPIPSGEWCNLKF